MRGKKTSTIQLDEDWSTAKEAKKDIMNQCVIYFRISMVLTVPNILPT